MTLDHVSTPKHSLDQVRAKAMLVAINEERDVLGRSRAELYQAIREAHAAGHTLRAIGEAAGVSHQRIAQLLKKDSGNE